MWLRLLWAQIVTGNTVPEHYVRGVDIRPMFWTEDEAAGRNRTQVLQYLAPEAGKAAQKVGPVGFDRVGHFYGVLGRELGFREQQERRVLPSAVAEQVEIRLYRWARLRSLARGGRSSWLDQRRPGDGLTARGMTFEHGLRLLAYAERAAGTATGARAWRRWRDRRWERLTGSDWDPWNADAV